jgi:hypothetical protein
VLVIRSEQMDALGSIALRAFEDEMLLHLGEFSPTLAKAIGDEQLRQAIGLGISRAFGHGLTFRGPVRLYLELMLLFGSHFDTDPQYRWAAEILTDHDSRPQMQRAQLLYHKTIDYRQQVAGPDDVFTFRALRNIQSLLRQPPAFAEHDFLASMRHQIEQAYPQKAAYVGRDDLDFLIREGIDRAAGLGFTIGRETALMAVLMLSFGHACAGDPLYPWIARTLQDSAIVDPPARADRLTGRAIAWLEHVLAN